MKIKKYVHKSMLHPCIYPGKEEPMPASRGADRRKQKGSLDLSTNANVNGNAHEPTDRCRALRISLMREAGTLLYTPSTQQSEYTQKPERERREKRTLTKIKEDRYFSLANIVLEKGSRDQEPGKTERPQNPADSLQFMGEKPV
jgi:hypothetical protein